ncbi:MAG: HNH endonuclease [Verrucomicrobium sp.]
MAKGKSWSRDELLIVLNIYEKLPFGLFDQRQRVIQQVAERLGRTSSSVAMKLGNLASLDPVLHARGRKGLPGASKLDREAWNEFQADKEKVAAESEAKLRLLFGAGENDDLEVIKDCGVQLRHSPLEPRTPPSIETSVPAQVVARRGQQYFRQIVINAYDAKCCITGLPLRDLLVASHILPWSSSTESRLDQRNGLCLNRLHDAAFDQGLITLDDDLRVVVSPSVRSAYNSSAVVSQFLAYEGTRISAPEGDLAPNPRFIAHHREEIFKS